MVYNELSCAENAGNTGIPGCVEDFGYIEKIILAFEGFEIATKTLAETEATWITGINAAKGARIYPLPVHFNIEPDQEERVQEEGIGGKTQTVREGKDRLTAILEDIPFELHKQLRTHNGRRNLAVYEVTSNGYIRGKSLDDTKMLPLAISDFYVEKRTFSDGNTIDRTRVRIEYENASQWNDAGVWVKPTAFDPLQLDGIHNVRLAGTVGATGMTLTVTESVDGAGIAGLIAANFNFRTDAAPDTPIAVTVGTDNGDGTYILTWADQTGNGAVSFDLFDQPIGTNGYESINTLTASL